MAKVAILGFGTVGSGVWEILSQNAGVCARRAGVPVEVGYICDIRDFSAHQAAGLFVNNIEPILQDKDVKVVVETIGGLHPAYEYVRAALESGRVGIFVLGGMAYCKRLHVDENGACLVSANPAYAPIALAPETEYRVCGEVLA